MKKPGSWPLFCRHRAFVDGAAWWEFTSRGATMWASDRGRAEAEAVLRYGRPKSDTFWALAVSFAFFAGVWLGVALGVASAMRGE